MPIFSSIGRYAALQRKAFSAGRFAKRQTRFSRKYARRNAYDNLVSPGIKPRQLRSERGRPAYGLGYHSQGKAKYAAAIGALTYWKKKRRAKKKRLGGR